MSAPPETDPAARPPALPVVAPRRHRHWLLTVGWVALPLVLAALLFRWHARRETYGGHSAAEWSLKLQAGQPAERQQAEAALRALGSNAVPSLCRALLKPDSRFRALGQRAARRAPPTLRNWIYTRLLPPDPSGARMAAAQGLALLGPAAESAIPDLVDGLWSKDASIAWQAANTLSRIGPAAVPALMPLLQEAEDAVRLQATYALGRIGRPASAALPALRAALDTTNQALGQVTLQALASIWTNPVPHYSNLLWTLRGPSRETAARALRQFNFPSRSLQPALIEMSHDEAVGARQAAVQALGTLTGWTPASFSVLCRALTDPDGGVRTNATVALADANLRARASPRSLAELLADPGAEFRVEAARALGRLGAAAAPALPELESLAAGPEGDLREAAREALGRITNAPAR